MDDVRLTVGLTAWLQDGEVPPPDARMSAGRVMAGVEQSRQLGRWWPPAALAGKVQPVPALGAARPVSPSGPALGSPAQPTTTGVASRLTPLRIVAGIAVLVLIAGASLIVPRVLPGPAAPSAGAMVLPASPSATSAMSPSPMPTPRVITSANGRLAPSTHSGDSWALEWQGGGIGLLADRVSLRTGDLELTAPGEVLATGSTYADHAELEAHWIENDAEQRLDVYLALDEGYWWLDSIRVDDRAAEDGGWIYFEGLQELTRTPLGQRLEGDLQPQEHLGDASLARAGGRGDAAVRWARTDRVRAGFATSAVAGL